MADDLTNVGAQLLPGPPQPPMWAQTIGNVGETLSKMLMAMDPVQSIPYMISEQPAPKRWLASHPRMADLLQTVTTLGLSQAAGHFGTPGAKPLSDDEAMSIANEHYPLIQKTVASGVKRGNVHPQDEESMVSDMYMHAMDLAKKYDATKGDFANYLTSSIKNKLMRGKSESTDALDRANVGVLNEEGETAPLHELGVSASEAHAQAQAAEAVPEVMGDPRAHTAADIAAMHDYINSLTYYKPSSVGKNPRTGADDPTYPGTIDQAMTGKLRSIARDYLFRQVPTKDLVRRYRVSYKTIADINKGAGRFTNQQLQRGPIKMKDLMDTAGITPEQIQTKIDALPENLQVLARKFLQEGKDPGQIARETGRNRSPVPSTQDPEVDRPSDGTVAMLRQISEIMNKLK